MFERIVSPAALLLWLLVGAAFASIWYALTAAWPPIWARVLGGMVLFALVFPLEAALARRHQRRTRPVTRHRRAQPASTPLAQPANPLTTTPVKEKHERDDRPYPSAALGGRRPAPRPWL